MEQTMYATIKQFEDIGVWQDSMNLCTDIYKKSFEIRQFPLRDQIQRASLCIPSNIAEGIERGSNYDFIRYLSIAKGFCGELRTQVHLAIELNLLRREEGKNYIDRTRKISEELRNLIDTKKDNIS
jgi:four helix bundle protein